MLGYCETIDVFNSSLAIDGVLSLLLKRCLCTVKGRSSIVTAEGEAQAWYQTVPPAYTSSSKPPIHRSRYTAAYTFDTMPPSFWNEETVAPPNMCFVSSLTSFV